MDGEVKNEKVTEDKQVLIMIEPKQETDKPVEMFEPKVKLIDEMDVKMEEIDDSEYQHILPYECQDYLEQQPTNSRKILAENKKMLVDCQKCGNGILLTSFTEAKEHAATHTDLKSFKCEQMVDECFPGFIEQLLQKTDGKEVKIEEDDSSFSRLIPFEYDDYTEQFHISFQKNSTETVDFPRLADELDAEVENEKVTDDGQIRILIEPKQEINESLELIEPKVELIDGEDVKMVEIDKTEYQHIIPYEYRDYSEQHTETEQPTKSRKRPADDSTPWRKDSIQCRKCGKAISSDSKNMRSHAFRHTSLKMYECPANQCGFKAYESSYVIVHMRRIHNSFNPVIKTEMSNEERKVLNDMVYECFPKRIKLNIDVICQLCHRNVKDCEQLKRKHSNGHINPILFKCKEEEDCNFSTNWVYCFFEHVYSKHQKAFDRNDWKQLLKKQEMKMQKWNDRCFSNKDVKEEDLTETIDYPAPTVIELVEHKKQAPGTKLSLELDGYTCQICKKTITEDDCDTTNRRIHASKHDDILLCSVPNCQFQTKYLVAMNNHQLTVHVSEPASSSGTSFRFMTAQEWGIERMLGRCFPELIKK